MLALAPAKRAGTPDEVWDLCEFLMSSRGRFITGADFLIDGEQVHHIGMVIYNIWKIQWETNKW